MEINIFQAILLGFFASLSSMPGMGGTTIGNYTLGRPLVGGLVCGIILGDIQLGIIVGAAVQVVYIALITPGGAVAADTRAISYIGVPLAMVAISSLGIDPNSAQAIQMATAFGAAVGTLGTVLYYGTVTFNLIWQHKALKAVNEFKFNKLNVYDMAYPWIGHILTSFIPTIAMTLLGASMVELIKETLPMDGLVMKTLFTVGSLLPAVGIGLLLKQVAQGLSDLLVFLVGFTLAAVMGVNLIGATILGGFIALMNYKIEMAKMTKGFATADGGVMDYDDEEEEI
ncbi:PTS system mannose-specific IIC component [Alkalibaculum bacchi]|uniref:PTS system mannose-specific IIC component n=1 Tax=Alkalibaculum bacchi TaxID=645887 RepID=A0A366I6E1_9FIRM|nr:PTS sugar transporter subunit IIC [Alkalibaculum bacchi]RBP63338.1 PTS system mannose-specific IIC component [Alkalibaculum bacchi]